MRKHLGPRCDICGDVGKEFLLTVCTSCLKSCEHIYCMRVQLRKVPLKWHCEACPQLKDSNSLLAHRDQGRSRTFPRSHGEEVQAPPKKQKTLSTDSPKMPNMSTIIAPPNPSAHQLVKFSRKVENRKVRFFPVENNFAPKTKASNIQGGFGLKTKRTSPVAIKTALKSQQKGRACRYRGHSKPLPANLQSSTPCEQSHSQKSPPHVLSKLGSEDNLRKINTAGETVLQKTGSNSSKVVPRFELNGSVETVAKDKCDNSRLEDFDKHAEVSVVLNDRIHNEYSINALVRTDETGILYTIYLSKAGEECPTNSPAIMAAWKGSFKIVNSPSLKMVNSHGAFFYGGIQAYHPGKVSKKAYNYSKKLPRMLYFKQQPRSAVWPFGKVHPTVNDIALYFFPGDLSSSTEKYVSLCEFIETNDLSLRSCINDVELLIFSSKHLPINCQKLKQHSYLWGVLRPNKARRRCVTLERSQETGRIPSLEYKSAELVPN